MPSKPLNLTRNDLAKLFNNDPRAIAAFEQVIALTDSANWGNVDFTGSSLTDIETRPHSDLQNIGEADENDTDSTKDKHVSNSQLNNLKLGIDSLNTSMTAVQTRAAKNEVLAWLSI